MITAEQLKAELSYDPTTGEFRRMKGGAVAGTILKNGYARISVLGSYYPSHHLACLYMTGRFPSQFMDHIDGVRSNNRWSNLREATSAENNQNMPDRKDNTSGYRGVFWDKGLNKWRAALQVSGKKLHLGVFQAAEEAFSAYAAAKASLHTFQPTTR